MSFGWGKSESHAELPKELQNIITQGWEELGGLRQGLIGQLMGVLTGGGAYEYADVSDGGGHWQTVQVPTGTSEGEGGPAYYRTERRWVGNKPNYQWVETGGPNATLPIIQQAEEGQRRATSAALRETETGLAQKGLVGTPFGENILAQQRQQGATALAGIEPNIIGQLFQMIPGFVQGNASSIMGSLGAGRTEDAKSIWSQGGV
jgi:hypothetical protein